MDNGKKKILLVEDEKDFLWILKESFGNHSLSLITAENGENGLELAEKENPDLIIIDIKLPGMDGIEMAKKIKERGINSKMIFLTNFDTPEFISRAMEAVGQTDYIVKSDIHIDAIVQRAKEKLGIK